jgi:hypothetical protein
MGDQSEVVAPFPFRMRVATAPMQQGPAHLVFLLLPFLPECHRIQASSSVLYPSAFLTALRQAEMSAVSILIRSNFWDGIARHRPAAIVRKYCALILGERRNLGLSERPVAYLEIQLSVHAAQEAPVLHALLLS